MEFNMPLRPRWRLLSAPARDGAENMARDLALLEHSRQTGNCVLSVYSWSHPTLSFGRNQTAAGLYDLERISAKHIDIVRRPTGGRAILHDHEITYSVTGPDAFAPTLTAGYDRINALLVSALRDLGANVEIATPDGAAPRPDQSPCFAEPVKGELTAGGRKLVGSAQYREAGAFLQHGSILLKNDQTVLSELKFVDREEDPTPATLDDLVPTGVTQKMMAAALFDAVRQLEDPKAIVMDESEIRSDALRIRPQFTNPEWTWRR